MSAAQAEPKRSLGLGHIYVALATGVSILTLTFVSKRILEQQMRPLYLGIGPFMMLCYELIAARTRLRLLADTRTWVVAILLISAAVVLCHVIWPPAPAPAS
jgi:hypothetical protein